MGIAKDETGKRYGRLTVIARATAVDHQFWWSCICDCGGRKDVRGTLLRNGATASCGCLHRERASAVARLTHTRHGQSSGERRAAGYRCWESMRDRCDNPRSRWYPRWGGRGIAVCAQWQTFEQFIKDMGPRPSRRHSIDRIDNNGNYEPGNCRWAVPREQARNMRNNLYLTANGRRLLLVEWAELSGISYFVIWERVRRGWTHERAVSEPTNKKLGRAA